MMLAGATSGTEVDLPDWDEWLDDLNRMLSAKPAMIDQGRSALLSVLGVG